MRDVFCEFQKGKPKQPAGDDNQRGIQRTGGNPLAQRRRLRDALVCIQDRIWRGLQPYIGEAREQLHLLCLRLHSRRWPVGEIRLGWRLHNPWRFRQGGQFIQPDFLNRWEGFHDGSRKAYDLGFSPYHDFRKARRRRRKGEGLIRREIQLQRIWIRGPAAPRAMLLYPRSDFLPPHRFGREPQSASHGSLRSLAGDRIGLKGVAIEDGGGVSPPFA